jgi:predicted 2-oxoglutarate/Fe(II)-dependent dioxygenase YbiX
MAQRTGIYLQPRFLPPAILHEACVCVGAASGELAAVQPSPGAALAANDQIRRAWEVDLPEAVYDEIVSRLRRVHGAIESWFGVRLEPCEAVAVLRYPPGSFYRTHRDVAAAPDAHGLHRRAVSLVLFLNSAGPAGEAAFSGGTLRLHGGDAAPHDIVPVAGTLVAFRSSVLHEVTPVESGTRLSIVSWLLQSSWPT